MPLPIVLFAALLLVASPAGSSEPTSRWQTADMRPSCGACTLFYRYANGGWLDSTSLPAGKSRWGTYDEVAAAIRAKLERIVEDGQAAAADGGQGNLAKIGTFYSSCMNQAAADQAGLGPVRDELAAIERIRTREDVAAAIRRLKLAVPDLLFWADVETDPFDPRRHMLHVNQAGLSLPEAELYASSEPEGREAVEALQKAAAQVFELSGSTPAAASADAQRLVALERALAAATVPPQQTRDVRANTNPMDVAAANRLTPHWDWISYFRSAGASTSSALNVRQPRFFAGLDRALATRSVEEWRAYLKWHLLYAAAPWLSEPLRDAHFAFDSSFSGTKEPQPRHQQCMAALNDAMGPALGAIYLDRHFTAEARQRGERMAANLKAVMAQRIDEAEWMSRATRAKALVKLEEVRFYLGGPTRIPDYSTLDVVPGPLWGNVAAANRFATRHYAARLSQPTRRDEWYMLPQSYSGAADHGRNSFQYPAGKFHPPFFDPDADDALNYGALGATMGHELTHLFDDRGRQYDEHGALNDWWAPGDSAAFTARAEALRRQFDRIRINGEAVNGTLTLSENVSDLGGLTIAYHALQHELQGKPRRLIDGFTPEQRFFLAWARNFRQISTPEHMRRQLRGGQHAPAEARVNGPLANMPEFHAAFGCRAGDPMYREPGERARIW